MYSLFFENFGVIYGIFFFLSKMSLKIYLVKVLKLLYYFTVPYLSDENFGNKFQLSIISGNLIIRHP
jgi:hypothetical protein